MINSVKDSRNKVIDKNFKIYQKEIRKIFINNRKKPDLMLEKYKIFSESDFFKRICGDISL